MTHTLERPPIPVVVQQHAEESAMLRHVRSVLVRAPHVRLRHLQRLDDRIAAHLDGLAVAGRYGQAICTAALERPGAGEVFALAVRAIEERDAAVLDRLTALSAALPEAKRGLLSAFGWVSAPQLQGLVRPMLESPDAIRRELGIAACRLHGVDPGTPLMSALRDDASALRGEAVRASGELGRVDVIGEALRALADSAEGVAFRAAAAACLLGDRGEAVIALEAAALREGAFREQATCLLLLATEFHRGREIVRRIAQSTTPGGALKRRVIRACGLLGDTQFIPWLIELMSDDLLARIAGESFSLITGVDLAALDLERKPPQGVQTGPNDDPNDDNVALDDDESLPWPDRDRVQAWWQVHAPQMPEHARCFMGGAPTAEHCKLVLREGTQRQRFVAAQQLCLQLPGTSLFPVCAPSWRQRETIQREE